MEHKDTMTITHLLRQLFNLGAQTDFWNSSAAARDFWLVFGAAVVGTIAYFGLHALQRRRERTHPFGHSFGR